MCGSRKNRTIHFLFHTEILSEHRTHRAPLIQTEIVYQYKKQFLSGVKSGKNTPAKNVGTHQRTPGLIRTGITTHPIFIVMAHKTAESGIGFPLLLLQYLVHVGLRTGKFHLPVHQPRIQFTPAVKRIAIGYGVRDIQKLLPVISSGIGADKLLRMKIFLDREQNLIRVDGFYEIIGDLLSHSLIHDILLLVLGDHDHWNVRHLELDPAECLQPRQAGHILVQKNQIRPGCPRHPHSVMSVIDSENFITFPFKKKNVRFQQINLIVHP